MQKIREPFLVSHFIVFFLIHSMQLGVGVLGFQRIVAKSAEQDAWISVVIAGLGVHVLIWMIYRILGKSGGDVTDVHRAIFGKWIGGVFTFFLILYFTLLSVTILRTYVEIVEVWVFPGFSTVVFSAVFLFLVFYIINGGFRAVAGIATIGVLLTLYLLISFVFPLQFIFFENLLPVMDHSMQEILLGAKDVSLSILGFEALLMYYPFLKEQKKSQKWAQMGALFTNLIYLLVIIISISYYSQEQLERTIWATLSILKIAELPFVERIEYIAIASWILVILPNICIATWSVSRAAKRLFQKKQRYFLILVLLIIYGSVVMLETREQVNMLNELTAQLGFYVLYGYIPLLFIVSFFYYRKKGRTTV